MDDLINAAKNNDESSVNSLVFLNAPIRDAEDDIIGFKAHVDTLQAAIDAGAQMIAITSPFGAGKSSVTELLQNKTEEQQVVNISMWSHLCKNGNDQTIELHRSFLYQIVSALNPKNGEYISRRLSKNYGLLKIHTESPKYYWAAFLSLVFFMIGYVLPYVFNVGIPTIWGAPELWNGLFVLISVICLVFVIVRAEIVFSSKKSEGALTIDENELKELYRKFVLEYRGKHKNTKKFIFVIEDLDRTDKHECVITFLKELRKYYTLANNVETTQNKIVFVVNVKPETSLCENVLLYKQNENESLYAKLFDFVLNIQTINIDDYETVLESILRSNISAISSVFPDINFSRLVDIPGMQWIIHGKHFGIRDVKDRLNRAFTLYASLRNRFPTSNIDFAKCAVVAYITTAYEQEFMSTDDRTFGELVEAYLQRKLIQDACEPILTKNGVVGETKEYAKEIFTLIKAKLIDDNYRMYFYNYPQNSKIYSSDEHAIQNAILYEDEVEGFDEIVSRVAADNVGTIYEVLDRLKKLKLPLPNIIFSHEQLFIAALHHFPSGIYEWVSELDYSQDAYEKTNKQLKNILSLDEKRTVFSQSHAIDFCNIWEEKIKETGLLQLRYMLSSSFSSEILWYKQLFMGTHNLIAFKELDLVSLNDAIQLINVQKDTFSAEYIRYILNRYEKETVTIANIDDAVQTFLSSAETKLGSSKTVTHLLRYMIFSHQLLPEYEESVMNQLRLDRISSSEKETIFRAYQRLINLISPENLTEVTLNNIRSIDKYDGYCEGVSNKLDEFGYVFEASIVRLHLGISVDFRSNKTVTSIKENLEWLLKHSEIFSKLRESVIKSSEEENILDYAFLFSEECPVLSTNEFSSIMHRYSEITVLKLIPASIVTTAELPMLINFFNSRFRHNATTYDFLKYIAGMSQAVAKECFYKLDFVHSIKYCTFSATRRNYIKRIFDKILGLDTVAEKIKFMDKTRFMDSTWEESILNTVQTNLTLQKCYIDAVNKAEGRSITNSTVKCICSFSTFYALKDIVTLKLYTAKKFMHYVICKTLYHKQFILDSSERIETLWETYMTIFSGSNHRDIRGYMDSNQDFLKLIMDKKAYTSLSNERRMVLSKIPQDAHSIQESIDRGDSFAIDYYQKIIGFANENAEELFINNLKDKPNLLRSKAIYDHCHSKLKNSVLKAKYTRLRKKGGYV